RIDGRVIDEPVIVVFRLDSMHLCKPVGIFLRARADCGDLPSPRRFHPGGELLGDVAGSEDAPAKRGGHEGGRIAAIWSCAKHLRIFRLPIRPRRTTFSVSASFPPRFFALIGGRMQTRELAHPSQAPSTPDLVFRTPV